MSLINQMLQDLEKRRASGAERGALPDQVRVLPREEARSMPWWLVGIAVAAALIAAVAWQFNSRSLVTPATPVSSLGQIQAPPAAAVTPGTPASRLALDLAQVPPSVAATPAPRTTAPPPVKTNTVIVSAPATATNAAPAVVAADMPKPAAAMTEAPKSAIVAPQTPVAASTARPAITMSKAGETIPEARVQAALSNSQIDKRAQTLTPQQVAENEYRDAANFLNQGRLAEAQEGFRRALQNYPAHIGARQGLFGVLLDAKKSAEAEQVLQEGLKLNPNQPGFAMALASLQFERGDIGGSIETMQKAAPAAQSSPDYLARLAGLLQRQTRHKEAVDYYQAALRLAPGSGVWLMGMGISLQALNRNGEAVDAFRRAKSSNTLSADLQTFVDQRLKQLQ
jgi:MSHA biogenesis protein MshN